MIFHVISSLTRGGKERQLSTIVFNTDQEKYPTRIVYFNASANHYFDEYKLQGLSVKIRAKKFWRRLAELNRLIKNETPHLIYTWGNLESVFILLLSPFHKFKFINGSVRHGIRSNKVSHYFRSVILHLSRFVIANSQAGLRANNLNRGDILYNGIDNKFIGRLPGHMKIAQRDRMIGSPKDALVLISVANIVPYKDYDTILKSLKGLKEQDYHFYYLVLGDGPLKGILEQKIRSCGLEENISILGNIPNVHEYLQISDVFIHSSKGEGCSNAILEAMAAGLPVIASDTGGTPEIVSRKNGFLFEYGNHVQLESCLKVCMDNPNIREKLGNSSLAQVTGRFTVDAMMKSYYRILHGIAGN